VKSSRNDRFHSFDTKILKMLNSVLEFIRNWRKSLGSTTIVALLVLVTFRRTRRISETEAKLWALICLRTCSTANFDKNVGLPKLMSLESAKSGEVTVRVRVNHSLQNPLHSLHGGAAAMLVDNVTSAAIMSSGSYPGVSVALSLQFVEGCSPGELLSVTAKVTKRGETIMHSEAKIKRQDGTLVARGTHVKYVGATPLPFKIIQRLRPWLLFKLLKYQLLRLPSLSMEDKEPPRPASTDREKAQYYGALGTQAYPLIGFDAVFGSGLRTLGEGRFVVNSNPLTNVYGAMHGAATATLVDIVGSCAIARHPEAKSCGVATNLEVQFGVPATGEVDVDAKVLRLGGRVAHVEVQAKDSRGRLVAQGSVTKYGKLR
jgi:acyl-coenzyme A thioesterase 13